MVSDPWPERDNKAYGWQGFTVMTCIPQDKVKQETDILFNGLPLFDKVEEWTNGYSREELEKVLFPAAELYAECDPDAERIKIARLINEYVPRVDARFILSRESAYFYFRKKYKGLREAVTAKFTEKQERIRGRKKV